MPRSKYGRAPRVGQPPPVCKKPVAPIFPAVWPAFIYVHAFWQGTTYDGEHVITSACVTLRPENRTDAYYWQGETTWGQYPNHPEWQYTSKWLSVEMIRTGPAHNYDWRLAIAAEKPRYRQHAHWVYCVTFTWRPGTPATGRRTEAPNPNPWQAIYPDPWGRATLEG